MNNNRNVSVSNSNLTIKTTSVDKGEEREKRKGYEDKIVGYLRHVVDSCGIFRLSCSPFPLHSL